MKVFFTTLFLSVFVCVSVAQNQAPTDIKLSKQTFKRSTTAKSSVGKLTAIDPNASDLFSYTLVPGDSAKDNYLFEVFGDSLRTRLQMITDDGTEYLVRIRATDPYGTYTEKGFKIGTPIITVSNSMINFGQLMVSSAKEVTYQLSAQNLISALTVTPPAGFQVSIDGTNFTQSSTINTPNGVIGNKNVIVRFNPQYEGDFTGSLIHKSTDALDVAVQLAGESGVTTIDVDNTLIDFGSTAPGLVSIRSYDLNVFYADDDITLTVPEGFGVSLSENNFSSSITLAPAQLTSPVKVYVQFAPVSVGTYSGTVFHGYKSQNLLAVQLSGSALKTGVEEASIAQVRIYPNPLTNGAQLNIENPGQYNKLTIADLSGRVVATANLVSGSNQLSINAPVGLYIVVLQGNDKQTTSRLLIQ